MASKVKDTTSSGLFDVPEPVAVRTRMCFPGLRPEDPAEGAILHTFISLEEFRRIHKVFQVAIEDSCLLYSFKHTLGFSSIAAQRFCCDNGFLVFDTQHYSRLMQVIGKGDTDHVHIRMGNRFFHISCVMITTIILGKFLCLLFPSGIDRHYPVFAAQTLNGICIKPSDKSGT